MQGDAYVVVIGRNKATLLGGALRSAMAWGSPIVYVDSGSTDDSVAVALQFSPAVTVCHCPPPYSAAHARNVGFEAAAARSNGLEYVMFMDGDCELIPGFRDEALHVMEEDPALAVVCGWRREKRPLSSIYNFLCNLEWNAPAGRVSSCGGDALVRATAFRAVGGFTSALTAGEESELCRRLTDNGWHILRLACDMTRHDARIERFGQWWRRNVRTGHSYMQLLATHRAALGLRWRSAVGCVVATALVPLVAVVCGALYGRIGFLVLAAYAVPVWRGYVWAQRRGAGTYRSAIAAMVLLAAKAAVAQGMAEQLSRRANTLVEYDR